MNAVEKSLLHSLRHFRIAGNSRKIIQTQTFYYKNTLRGPVNKQYKLENMMLDVIQLNIRRECPTETYFVYQEQMNCGGFSVTLFLFSCFI